jgi:mannose-6-phosphate isomerase-like protein (cupin superfamily)
VIYLLEKLREMAKNYLKVKPNDFECNFNLKIDSNSFNVEVKKEDISVSTGLVDDALITMKMNEETWNNLVSKKWNGMTAAGRERMSQPAPLDFEFSKKINSETMQKLYHLAMHFFNTTFPTYAKFGIENTRKIHGGNAVPLAYGHGVRSAYYIISGDEQANSEEKDPWWQCFIIIGGKGVANIDNKEIDLENGMAIHVPPNVIHTFKAKPNEKLEFIWIAYGKGA